MQERNKKIFILFLIPFLLYLVPLPFSPLMEPDEGRYSSIPSAMNQSGDYVTPRLKAAVYFEKPPLCYWATAMAFKLFGENEFASRLFAALCAWGCILLVYRMGLFFHDTRTGLYAAAVLSTFLYHAAIARINILDMPLAFFVCLAIWCGFRTFAEAQMRKRYLYLLYLSSALAFLAKGLIGIVFPFGIVILWLLISRRWKDLFRCFSPVGILIFALLTLPWLVLVQQANPDFFRFFFIQEHWLRYTTRMHDRYQPVYFYLPILLAGTLPWCAFLPEALRGLRGRTAALFGGVEKRFLLTWILVILIFFSISSSKLIPYIAPLFIPLALGFGHLFRNYEETWTGEGDRKGTPFAHRLPIVLQPVLFMAVLLVPLFLRDRPVEWGNWWPWISVPFLIQLLMTFLPDLIRKRFGTGRYLTIYLLFALFLVFITLPAAHYLEPYKSARPLAQAIKSYLPAGATLYQYGMSLYGIDFYNGSRTPIVDDIGEVRYGAEQLPAAERDRYFLTTATFFHLIREQKTVYCATEKGERLERLKKEFPDLEVIWHNSAYCLLKLNSP